MQREVIEKRLVAGRLSHTTEVFQCLDQPGSEKLFPVAIHRDACGQRLPGHKEPLREGQPVERRSVRKLRKIAGTPGARSGPILVRKFPRSNSSVGLPLVGLLFLP